MSVINNNKIVLIAPNWLGDAVMSLPLAGFLGAARGVSLCVFAPEYVARVYGGIKEISELVVFSERGRVGKIKERARALRALGAGTAVILPPSFSSAVAPFLARLKRRVGFRTDGRAALLTNPVERRRERDTHLSEEFIQLGKVALNSLGVEPPESYITPTVSAPVSGLDLAKVDGGESTHVPIPNRYALVVPGATYGPAKSWPWECYRELVDGLSKEISVVLAGGPGDRDKCELIAGKGGTAINLCGRTTLDQFITLINGAAVVVANDSGAPHVSASLGIPTVVLFGSTSPEWTAPRGKAVEVVRNPVHCSPCFRKDCPTELECFTGIETSQVLGRTLAALGARAEVKSS